MRVDGKFKFWGGLACHIWGGGKELMKQLVAAGLPDRPMVIRYRARATLPEGVGPKRRSRRRSGPRLEF
jgi:hypothetical protein